MEDEAGYFNVCESTIYDESDVVVQADFLSVRQHEAQRYNSKFFLPELVPHDLHGIRALLE